VRPDGTLSYNPEGGASFCVDGNWGTTPPTILAWIGEGGPTQVRCVGAVVPGRRYDLIDQLIDRARTGRSPVLHVQVWTGRDRTDPAPDLHAALAQARTILGRAGLLAGESDAAGESPSDGEIHRALAELFLSRTVELRLFEQWPLGGRVVTLKSGSGARAPAQMRSTSEPISLLAYDLRSGAARPGHRGSEQPERPVVTDGQPPSAAPGDVAALFGGAIHMWAHGVASADTLALQRYDDALRGGGTDLDAWASLSEATRKMLGQVTDEGSTEAARAAARRRVADRRAQLRAFEARAGETLNRALQATAADWAARQTADAPYTAEVVTVPGLSGDHRYELAICRGGVACGGGDRLPAPDDLTAERTLRLHRHRTISLAVELALDGLIGGSIDYGGYAFVPVGSGEGPSRLYQLQGDGRFIDHVSTSVLLVAYPFARVGPRCLEGWFVGAGTSLFEGTTANLFKQLDLRFGVELTHGLLLSTGPSFRSVEVPADLAPGTIVAVGLNAPAPTFGTTPETTFAWSIGLALDLTVLADAVDFAGRAFRHPGGARP